MFNWFKKNKEELVTDVLPSSKEECTMKYVVNREEITLPFKTRIVTKKYIFKGKEEYIPEVKVRGFPYWVICNDGIPYFLENLSSDEYEELSPILTTKEEAQKRIDLYIQNYLEVQYTTTYEDYP